MIKVEASLEKLRKVEGNIREIGALIGDIAFEAGKKNAELVKDRVAGQGLATNGSFLVTPAEASIGSYSQSHGRQREKRGLPTDMVDLHFTGQMWDSWGETRNGDETGVGFSNETAIDKARWNEELYGTLIFKPSAQEKLQIIDLIRNKIKEALGNDLH